MILERRGEMISLELSVIFANYQSAALDFEMNIPFIRNLQFRRSVSVYEL